MKNPSKEISPETEKLARDVMDFLQYEIIENTKLSAQIKEACDRLGIPFKKFVRRAFEYAMYFSLEEPSNDLYDDISTSLAIYFCAHMRGSFNRVRHKTVLRWLKRTNPESITDCGYGAPSDYMLDKEFIRNKKINLIEVSQNGEIISKIIFDINKVPLDNFSFLIKDMNDYEYLCDSEAYLFLDTIEHVKNPDKYLKIQVDNAKKGSWFIFSIPIGKIDSLRNLHFMEWLSDQDAKNWVESAGLKIFESRLATINPKVDLYARPIIGGTHDLLLLCRK